MANARQILLRRRTVQNIVKITHTMEMIATSRFRQFQARAASMRAYADGLTRMVYHTVQDARLSVKPPLLERHDDAGGEALVVMVSNRGLCGGYNANILRLALERIRQGRGEGRQVDVYAIGKRSHRFLRFRGIEPVWEIAQFERDVDPDAVDDLAGRLMDRFTAGELRSVQVAGATFVSTSVQRPELTTLLPLGEVGRLPPPELAGAGRPLGAGDYDYMPDPERILNELLPRSVTLRLYQAFLDAILSEQVARMTAMHLASENGEEMIRSLTMAYNRVRQATITTELAEIVTGVEAMK
ncbi:MAG: ATP synthase F1 subunit gamma [Planctomycetes bacterium]|nr:ATP synthase F1 subunit gamma [Planctomycetota bacterium]